VRPELQADRCAGLWASHATTTPGPSGGQRWFTVGYQTGDLERCDTFSGSV
jgi:predicted metalloprotease